MTLHNIFQHDFLNIKRPELDAIYVGHIESQAKH